jgi:dTDP-glucose 4,6-dehydratase
MDERRPSAPSQPHDGLIKYVEDRPGHDHRYAVDCAKIERELGWRPATSFDEGLAKTVDWYLENVGWIERIRVRGFKDDRIGLGGASAGAEG